MDGAEDWLRIGALAELVGLSIPQLRRFDRRRLLEPAGRPAGSEYRYHRRGQTGAARVIALLRSMDMSLAEIRRVVAGEPVPCRRFRAHRARLAARLEEVRRLLEAVDALTEEEAVRAMPGSQLSSWLHLMPRLPVSDMERSIVYSQEALGFWLSWRTADGTLAALASGEIEVLLLLVPWTGAGRPPDHAAYVYVDDPDALCAE